MKYSIWAATIALVINNATATAALAEGNGVAFFNGEISNVSVDAFLEKYKGRDDLTEFSVASQGGDAAAALRLARWIHLKKLNVRVRVICFSGCASYFFVAGEKSL